MKALVIHGGGPTAVLNASLAGLALEWRARTKAPLFGARFGMKGLLAGDFIDLNAQPDTVLEAVGRTGGSALGSSRLPAEEAQVVEALDRFGITLLLMTGGNGTMKAAQHLSRMVSVVGIPKTIDNDLVGTDFTPGYGSCARFFACAARDVGEDNTSLPSPITVLETLGRDTGWVTAATLLARQREGDPPHLVYLPEQPVSLDQVCGEAESMVARWGRCVITVCEGQRDKRGQPFGASIQRERDGTRALASNLGHTLASLIMDRTGIRSRSEKPGLLGRSNPNFVSEVDRDASFRCGRDAARAALEGASGVMTTVQGALVPLDDVAGKVRPIPAEWIGSDKFLDYVRPLAGPIEPVSRLQIGV
jgi:ATP-dependent phosphofructokinase / diphosphate-dependent phosphofructokinase